jgi:hypothetical protein
MKRAGAKRYRFAEKKCKEILAPSIQAMSIPPVKRKYSEGYQISIPRRWEKKRNKREKKNQIPRLIKTRAKNTSEMVLF